MTRERIIQLGENLCVTAGAGAGKTGCLVEAYMGLLEDQPGRPALRPEHIVAITFTNKAADEMRQRIQRQLQAKAGDSSRGGPDWAALAQAVEWAPIGTIHSFCAALLREFGVLLGLDPDFAILEERDFSQLLSDCLAELLRLGLSQAQPGLARPLASYPLQGTNSLTSLLTAVYRELSTQGLTAAQARANTTQAHEQEKARWPGLLAALERLAGELSQAWQAGSVKKTTKYGAKIAQIVAQWPQSKTALAAPGAPASAALARLKELFGGNWGPYTEQRQQGVEILTDLMGLANLPAAQALADDLLGLAEQLEALLDQEMARQAVLSFDHLLLWGLRLLRENPSLLASLRQRYQALFVDEFQDVNPLQARLVFLLAGLEDASGPLETAPAAGQPRLLLVGDPKQSIYGFRGADKKAFDQAQQRVQWVALQTNWRSSEELVVFFNHIFDKVLQHFDDNQQFKEEYHIFSPADQQLAQRPGPARPGPAVEALDCRALLDGSALAGQWRQAEAQALAQRVAGLLAQGWEPQDIAILFRRMTQTQPYEQALRQSGAPFYVVGGKGFYQCQEIIHLALALRAVLDPADDQALAGVLGSPLVGLGSAALLAMRHPPGREERGLPLCQALRQGLDLPGWVPEPERHNLARWRELWLGLLPLARRLAPAELLECLLEATDYLPVLMATPGGAQQTANLRKLLETARQTAGLTPAQLARDMWALVNQPLDEGQAPLLGEGAQVVRLMSVHQAKGLEFPAVILADLAGGGGQGGSLLVGPGGVLAARPWDHAQGEYQGSSIFRRLRQREQARQAAEAARIFYVACTRARDKLIFCLTGAKRQGSWGKWVSEVVLAAPQTSLRPAEPPGGGGEAVPDRRASQFSVPDGPGPLASQAQEILERAWRPRCAPSPRVRESVSGLENWFTCPRLYVLTRRWGLDTAWLGQAGGPGAEPGGAGAEMGSLVHALLERTDLAAGPQGLASALASLAQAAQLEPAQAQRALSLARGLWDTELPAWLAGAPPGDIRRELPFQLFLPGEGQGPDLEMIGEFDLLAPEPSGGWLLADYKVSDHVRPGHYLTQMALYALALWQGQGGTGRPPRLLLCYLTSQGGQLRELTLGAPELGQWRARLLGAARDIAALPAQPDLAQLPRPDDCQSCALLGSGLCGLEPRP